MRFRFQAGGADNGRVSIFHGRVFADLMQNPLVERCSARCAQRRQPPRTAPAPDCPAPQCLPREYPRVPASAFTAAVVALGRARTVPVNSFAAHVPDAAHYGVMDSAFHPTQPWIVTAGADAVLRLFVSAHGAA